MTSPEIKFLLELECDNATDNKCRRVSATIEILVDVGGAASCSTFLKFGFLCETAHYPKFA
jgi:hypothetical protein